MVRTHHSRLFLNSECAAGVYHSEGLYMWWPAHLIVIWVNLAKKYKLKKFKSALCLCFFAELDASNLMVRQARSKASGTKRMG